MANECLDGARLLQQAIAAGDVAHHKHGCQVHLERANERFHPPKAGLADSGAQLAFA
jgi:hypothetical protein